MIITVLLFIILVIIMIAIVTSRPKHKGIEVSTQSGNTYEFKPSEADILLKEATRLKKEDNIDAAINKLKEAYVAISKTNIIYGIETFLRLPLYLQKAGRPDEAWTGFNGLLTNKYPNQIDADEIMCMDISIIYDKMGLFLEREKRYTEALKFKIISYLFWAKGLHLQQRKGELKEYISKTTISGTINKYLIKLKKTHLESTLVELISQEASKLPSLNINNIAKLVIGIIE